MKSKFRMLLAAIMFFAGLALPLRLAAQDKQNHNNGNQHHHYQLVDMGTFGGPQSRIDYAVPLNNSGMVSGSADTPS